MRPTSHLSQYSTRLTLFTRSQCSLCDTAKLVVKRIRDKGRVFEFGEVDVMDRDEGEGEVGTGVGLGVGRRELRELQRRYEWDVPVLHVQRIHHTYSKPDIATEAKKLMHRFKEEEVEALMDEAEGYT